MGLLANKNILRFWSVFLMVLQIPITALAGDAAWFIEDSGQIKKANESVNINPWNVAEITGGGANGTIELVTVEGAVAVELDEPLYKLSDGYSDKIIEKNGLWGVERNISVIVFDGSENWERFSQPGYQNKNTIIFSCTAPDEYRIQNGISTHFDVLLDNEQKNSIYDAVSFGRQRGTILMRFMNVRGIDSADSLKAYLKGQLDSGRPVKLLYPSVKSDFIPFSDEIQKQLNNSEVLGFRDNGSLRLAQNKQEILSDGVFVNNTSGNEDMDEFLVGITNVYIQNDENDLTYYIEGLYPDSEKLKVKIMDSKNNCYEGTLQYNETNFLQSKLTELELKDKDGVSIKIKINLSKTKVPDKIVNGFEPENTAIKEECIRKKNLVLPDYIPVPKNKTMPFYPENSLVFGGNKNDIETDGNILKNNCISLEDFNENELTLLAYGVKSTVKIVPVESNLNSDIKVLFLGDSLINENYYTAYVKQLFSDDNTNITLIGTRGNEDNRHEGRGGWSAYDYCNVSSKYGYTNPFLNNGSFDFKYYMESNKYDNVDMVVLNLGINDLNLIGHNGHSEILKSFTRIIESIHEFNSDIKILINLPTLPYESEATEIYKNDRLDFIEAIYNEFGAMEGQGIVLVPLYLSVDPKMSFKLIEPVIDEYNQDYSLIVTDTTHPSILGYKQMAQTTYNYIKFADSL